MYSYTLQLKQQMANSSMNYRWLSIYHSSVELAPGGALENINDRDVQYVNGKVKKLNNEVGKLVRTTF